LGRVNLLVGKNNVGKTSVLEALYLYASFGAPNILWDLIGSRDEQHQSPLPGMGVLSMFRSGPRGAMQIGSSDRLMTVGMNRYGRLPSEPTPFELGWREIPGAEILWAVEFTLEQSRRTVFLSDLPPNSSSLMGMLSNAATYPVVPAAFIPAFGLNTSFSPQLWDAIALTPMEEAVSDAVRIVIPDLDRISFLGSKRDGSRIPFIKLQDNGPLPLRRLGDGANRILSLALTLANARGGMVLIDEIENGVHHSVQPKVWEFIFRAAQQLDVQVFATTHSSDCLNAFSAAASGSPEAGLVTRLESSPSGVRAVEIEEELLAIVAQEHVEIR
jgi:hypothetical protein